MKTGCSKVQAKINRIKGQLNGVDKMIAENRDVLEVTQQIAAVRSALSSLALELLKDESQECLKVTTKEDKQKKFEKLVTQFFKIN